MTPAQKKQAIDDLHKLYGTGPYTGDMSNICYGDGYFANSIKQKYGVGSIGELEEMIRKNEELVKADFSKIEQRVFVQFLDAWSIEQLEQLVEMKRGPRPKVNIYDVIIQELSLHEVGMTGDFLNGMEYARELVRAMKGDK